MVATAISGKKYLQPLILFIFPWFAARLCDKGGVSTPVPAQLPAPYQLSSAGGQALDLAASSSP